MSNKPPRRLGWQPGSYKAAQRDGHFPGGPNARSAFDAGYDNGPQTRSSRRNGPAERAEAAFAAAVAKQQQSLSRLKSAPPVPARPLDFKLWREGPFAAGDYIFCTAPDGLYGACDGCGHRYFIVTTARNEIPRLKCQRCGMNNRQLRKADVA